MFSPFCPRPLFYHIEIRGTLVSPVAGVSSLAVAAMDEAEIYMNVRISASLKIMDESVAGGFVGYQRGNLQFSNCVFEGIITGARIQAGGFVGSV